MDYQIGEDLKEKVRHYPISSAVAQLTDEFRSFPVPSITSRARHWHTKMTLRMSLARNSMVWKMRKMRKVSTTMWVPLHICYPRQHTDLRDRIRNQTGVSQHDAALRPSAFRPHRQQDPMSTKSANSSDAGCLLRFLLCQIHSPSQCRRKKAFRHQPISCYHAFHFPSATYSHAQRPFSDFFKSSYQ